MPSDVTKAGELASFHHLLSHVFVGSVLGVRHEEDCFETFSDCTRVSVSAAKVQLSHPYRRMDTTNVIRSLCLIGSL